MPSQSIDERLYKLHSFIIQQLSGKNKIVSLTDDQDRPPQPQPGRVKIKVQSGLRLANSAKVRAEATIEFMSEGCLCRYILPTPKRSLTEKK